MNNKDKQHGPIVARVNSRSRPDVVYEVRCLDGKLSCNCKGWIFNRKWPKRCCHTDAVVESDPQMYSQYVSQAHSRKASVERRAGSKQRPDRVSLIVQEILAVGGYAMPAAGTLIRMAGVLRPYLQLRDLKVKPDAAIVAAKANDLVVQTARCITLED
jgi:hypothetical protein